MTYSEFRAQFSSVEDFMQAYGRLPEEEANALIDAEQAPNFIKACMITTWRQARRKAKLASITVRISENGELTVIFYVDKSEFDGDTNYFQYHYSIDADNTDAFLKTLPCHYEDSKTAVEEWLVNHINCEGISLDLRERWIQMGLHGKRIVHRDYAVGVSTEEKF